MIRTRMTAVAGAAVVALALGSCSNGSSGNDGSDGQPGGQPSGTQSDSSGGAGTVAVAKSGDFGRILVDAQGRTLYVFLSDTDAQSTCYGDCASNWPALTTDGTPSAGAGVDASMLGTTDRTDGSTQVTFDGHPLYMFSGDSAAGQTNGEGIGDLWFVLAPDGTPIKKAGGGYSGRY